MKALAGILGAVLQVSLLLNPAAAAPSFQQTGNTLTMSNADVVLEYHLGAGTADFYWQNAEKISNFYSGVTLSTGYVKGIDYSSWSYAVTDSNQVVVTATGNGLPIMEQHFTLDQNDSFLVRVDMVGTNLSANWMGPVVVDSTGWVNIGVTNDNRALVVPFDNDGFVTYNAMPMNDSDTGYEVAAFYDNTSRNGLVVGSVTHDTWKTGIFFSGEDNQLSLLNVFGGATAPADVMAHGSVTGNVISSPTVFVGFGADWRVTMQDFAAENTLFAPRLAWSNSVPFGWNSWGILQTNINYTNAIAVSDYFYVNLMTSNFNDNGTVYINLDSFWNDLSDSQLQSFASHCHAHGQKAGIYLGPFAWFGSAASATNTYVEGTTNAYLYSNILLRDGNGDYESVDGGLAVDPTHPGAKQRINYYINLFTNWGFDYVKLDFLSHGALEGVHYDPNVTTGIQAYNEGMEYVLNAINGRMFLSESIAPLFPYQYGHSRRIACDAQSSLIANTEYTMNSVSYGWWLDNLYQFNDPDIMVFNGYGATTNENQSRLISGAVTGVFLDGDDLAVTNGQYAAQGMLTNQAVDNVARVGQTFTPVESNTGTNAVNIFVRQNGVTWNIAVFNYTSRAMNETVSLSRAGLPPGTYNVTNLWDGTAMVAGDSWNVSLNAKQAKLFQLTAVAPADLRWSASDNDGVWDTGISTNWINLTNSQETVFNTGNQVLFDDTVGVPTKVTVSGTVLPNLVTVNSSINNFTFSGSGSIGGSGGLVKEGSSLLTIVSPANFSGPVTINGGAIYAGDYSFASVSSITITNNATLDFGGSSLNGSTSITVSGTGVNGEGALYNSSYALYDSSGDQTLDITLAGNATFGAASGGGSRWDLADGSTLGGPYKVTINFPGGYGEWDTVAIATNVGDLELAQGSWGLKGLGASLGNPANTLTVDSGATLDFWSGTGGTTSGYNKNIHVLANGTNQILTGFTDFDANMILENGAAFIATYGSGNQSFNGSFTLNGIAHFELGDANFIFTNVISGPGGFVWDAYDHEIIFQAANTYAGPTVIGSGLTLALTESGSIADSALIFFGGSNPSNNSLDVSGRSDQTLTLASGQTLAGIGGISGSLIASQGATLSPSGTNITLGITEGSSSTGAIAVSNAVTLNGTIVVKLNGSGINDKVQSGASITYGGTLSLVNISGSPLAVGNTFQIFSAKNCFGSFTNITPATPGTGLAWSTNQLNSGLLNVVAAPSQPGINSAAVLAGNLVFSGTNGTANGTFYVLTTTNLTTPLANWLTLSTNSFDGNGNFSVTNAINAGAPQRFYCIKLQ